MLETFTIGDAARRAREASRRLALASTDDKNRALLRLADLLESRSAPVLEANAGDVRSARDSGLTEAMIDRLLITERRLDAMAADVRHIVTLPDPIGEETDAQRLPNGLRIARRRVPLGVIGIIYESRPNVTIDISALCLKSGNAAILRGGKESRRSSAALMDLVGEALQSTGLPADAAQLVRDPDRALVGEMLTMRGDIDLIVPRGGAGLIDFVRQNSQIPVVAGGIGVCHTYVHADADLEKALDIVHNAKVRRPSVCNALDTVLVHSDVVSRILPSLAILRSSRSPGEWRAAEPDDFGREFLALRAAVRVVDSLDEAVEHIETYGSGHSEAIVTEGYEPANQFLDRIDAAAVFVNASTGFTDGAQFGLGAEIGISTQKFHARGPLGLREMTSYKWVVRGNGHIRS